jgi:lysophospholipase L1-like esterase
MKFHLEFDIKKLEQPIQLQNKLLLIGSCFTENIGEKLRKHKFQVLENPHGILFNPVSVVEALTDYITCKNYSSSDLFNYNEAWHSWNHHSRFSGLSADDSLSKINQSIINAHNYLANSDYLIITLGSAWLYTLTDKASNGKLHAIASNNHKAPSNWFEKRLMPASELVSIFEELIQKIKVFNPRLQILFTISPVRHLREGLVENNRSKAVLIQAVHQLVESNKHIHYFPAYELVIDDLRDYRFYAEDLVHPNYQATQYVFEKLVDSCMDENTKFIMKEIAEINLAYQHKPFNPYSEKHQLFLNSYFEKTKLLKYNYPFIDVAAELDYFEKGFKIE